MADLKKWFPFKFRRHDRKSGERTPAQETQLAPSPSPTQGGPLAPAWPAAQIPRLMQAMFSDPFFSHPLSLLSETDRFFGDFAPARFVPSVDIVDEGKAIKVSAELPGMDKEDVKLEVHDGGLLIRGEKTQENSREEEGCYRTERYYGSFVRQVPLPQDLDFEHAEATFDKGVLTVRLPKAERSGKEPTRIPVG